MLDPDKLKADSDAHWERLQDPMWARTDGQTEENWIDPVTDRPSTSESVPPPQPEARRSSPDSPGLENMRGLEALRREVAVLTEVVNRQVVGAQGVSGLFEIKPLLEKLNHTAAGLSDAMNRNPVEGVPGWLQSAAGNPRTYDAPNRSRITVSVRVLPAAFTRLKQTQARRGLRTMAGAWEYLLRLAFAADERLPAR